ncbi:Stc1 domain-containing protein [Terfezia claveryi]|nr:Stc1 domain-containing protein [Terfezia claveryi]
MAATAVFGNIEQALKDLDSRGITKIECNTCKRRKGFHEYSNKQLLNYKNSIHNEYAPAGRCRKTASCKDCVNGGVTHIECQACGVVKPLSKFLKVQRRMRDKARCKRCVQLDLETERGYEVEDPDDYEGDETGDDSDEDVDFPLGTKGYANESAICPVKDGDKDVDGGMEKAVEQMNIDAAPGSAPVVGSVTTSTATSDEWALVNKAGKGKSLKPGYTPTASQRFGGWVKEKNRPPVNNEWGVGACAGGQPRWFKKKDGGKKHSDFEDDLDEDDGEEI